MTSIRAFHGSILCIALGLTPPLAADTGEWFAALKVSLGEAHMTGSSHGNSIGTGAIIDGFVDGRLEDEDVDDYTGGLGFAVGRRLGYWTLEGEYVYRYRTDWDLAAPTPSIQTVTNVFSNVETHSLMVNLLRRGVINRNWSWELGVGAGLVQNRISGDYIERATATVPQRTVKDSAKETDFAYSALVGVSRALRGRWNVNVRYRYIDLGEVSVGPFPSRPARLSADHASHEIQFSLERSF